MSMNRSRGWLGLCIVALGTLLLGLVPYPRALAAAMRRAESSRASGQYGAALNAYDEASRLGPDLPAPWEAMGMVLLAQHRFDRASVMLQEAERLGGGPETLLALGKSYAGRGDWMLATQAWLRALRAAPGDARIYVALAQGSVAQGLFDQARAQLSRALALQPVGAQATIAHALLGRILAGDDPAEAAGHLRQAGDEDMLAVLNTTGAESDPAQRALLLGIAFLQRDELTLARRQLEQAVALDPASALACTYLGHALDRLGSTAGARDALEHALDLDPDSALAYYFLGMHDRQVGLLETAQADLWQALLRDPENAASRAALAQTFLELGEYDHAEEWYQAAVEAAPDDLQFHLLLVHFYLDHVYRIDEGGLPAAQAAVALAPDDARAQDLLGWAYRLAGHVEEAERALDRALVLDPTLVSAHFHLGSLMANTGRQDLARQHLQRAMDLDTTGYYRLRAETLLATLAP